MSETALTVAKQQIADLEDLCRQVAWERDKVTGENAKLRAQLLAARAEAFEEAAKMLDAIYDRDDCHSPDYYGVLRECAAALRAKGGGK